MSWNRRLFFALDKLHISASERYFMITLLLLLIGTGLVRSWVEPEGKYEAEYYEVLEKELMARRAVLGSRDSEIMKHYGLRADTKQGRHLKSNEGIEVFVPDSNKPGIRVYKTDLSLARADSAATTPDTVNKGLSGDVLQVYDRDKNTNGDKRILINKASVDALVQLPGIGPVIAGRIVQYRLDHGPFTSINDLRNVKGIGVKRLEDVLPYITL